MAIKESIAMVVGVIQFSHAAPCQIVFTCSLLESPLLLGSLVPIYLPFSVLGSELYGLYHLGSLALCFSWGTAMGNTGQQHKWEGQRDWVFCSNFFFCIMMTTVTSFSMDTVFNPLALLPRLLSSKTICPFMPRGESTPCFCYSLHHLPPSVGSLGPHTSLSHPSIKFHLLIKLTGMSKF